MKVKDPIKFVGGKDEAIRLVERMREYIKNSPSLRNCWVSYGGGKKFITPYKCVYSVGYKQLVGLLK